MYGEEMIRDVLLIQKRELQLRIKEEYIERSAALPQIDSGLIKVIMGPRRAGKSFYAFHALNKAGNFGYANFDDEKLVGVKDYEHIVLALNTLYQNPKYLLFDEIQNLPEWELFVNRLQRQGYHIVITGSNSKLLSREMATHLTGRHELLTILPLSFREIILHENKEMTSTEIRERLLHYLTNGGYPEPMIKKLDYSEYLSLLVNSTLYKDIVKRFKIRYVQALEDIAVYLISNIASEFSYNTLRRISRLQSIHTVQNYLSYLEEAFLLFRVDRFSYKIKEQITSNKKIYCIDNGLIHAKAFRFSSNKGRLLENLVAIELKKWEMDGRIRLYYWKNPQQEEVDFVLWQGDKSIQLIQVCYDIDDPKTKSREIRALLKASRELACNNILIITEGYENEEQAEWFGIRGTLKYVPLWKWLQNPQTPGWN